MKVIEKYGFNIDLNSKIQDITVGSQIKSRNFKGIVQRRTDNI